MSTQSILLEALRYLAARCDGAEAQDGQGFNKPDSWRGRQLSQQDFLNEQETIEALNMLRKYAAGQLAEAKITLPEQEKAATEAREGEQTRGEIKFDKAADLLTVHFPFNQKHVAAIKTIPKARFHGNGEKYWTVPLADGKALLAAFPKFAATDEAKQAIDTHQPPAVLYAGKVALDKDTLIVSFEYDPKLVVAVKAIKGARFDGEHKRWKVPAESIEQVVALPNFEIASEVTARLEADRATAKVQAEKDEQVANKLLSTPLPDNLFAHQRDGVKWLWEHRRAILADDMGLGKTRQALLAAKAYGLPIIVICPASLLINWQREAATVDTAIKVYSWGKIPKQMSEDFVLIADEAHYAQSLKSARTKALLALSKNEHCMGAYMLTGTPIKNGRPCNLYPLLEATRHKLAENRGAFEMRYCAAKATRWTKWDTSGASHLDELHALTKDVILRRMKKECLDLPEKLRVIRAVELSAAAQKTYDASFDAMRKEYHQRISEGKISSESEALVMLNHVRHAGSIAKAETAIELSEETLEEGQQIVLFVAFKESGEQIAKSLKCKMLSGDATTEERQQMVDDFQAGKDKALVCTFGAGGVGITLTAAQTVVLVDRPWTPGDATQSEDRLHRIGQQNAVTAIWLQCGETDEAIDALLQSKEERIELVLAGKRKTLRGVGSPMQAAQEILQGLMGE